MVDKNWRRLKIKNPKYLEYHHVLNNGNLSKRHILEILNDYDSFELGESNLRLSMLLKYYEFRKAELLYKIDCFINYTRALYEEYNHNRASVAAEIKNHKLAAFGFYALKDNEITAEKLVNNLSIATLCKLIADYEEDGEG